MFRTLFFFHRGSIHLSRAPRNEEPLINTRINRCGCKVLTLRNPKFTRILDSLRTMLDRRILERNVPLLRLPLNQPLPRLRTLLDHIHRILSVLALARKRKLVFRLAVRDLVDPEPFVGCADEPGQVALDVLDVVEFRGQGVVDVDDEDLPVGFAFVEECHHAQHFDLLDLPGVADGFADFAHVERVVVAGGFGVGVDAVGVFPGLVEHISM